MQNNTIQDNRFKIISTIAFVCIILDQLTKAIIVHSLDIYGKISVIPGFFDLVHIQNRGAAFGFLNRSDINWQFWLFAIATIVALFLIYSISRTSSYNKKLFICFGLIVGGAIGNFIDRIRYKAVTDFLDFYVGTWHWPAFNVADITISIGAFGAAILLYTMPENSNK